VNKVVLVTGSSGFVGQSVLRQTDKFRELTIVPLQREIAAERVRNIRREFDAADISLLNLAWPSMKNVSSTAGGNNDTEDEWPSYKRWMFNVIDAAAEADVRFFQIGSGIERYAETEPPLITDPYFTYAYRKAEIWNRVQATMPSTSWRLLLHFLFGAGESLQRVVPAAILACLTGEAMSVGAPARRRCWLDIDDATHGLLTATQQADAENWDICRFAPVSFDELFTLIGEATGKVPKIEASDRAVADSNCPLVEPRNPAPFLREGAGESDDLRQRLIDYARLLDR
jgi:nucleoside-diphosphate-sugar epimerase